ncbi:hypothetical protein V8C26DRAFT_98883 [Trichoderma gracile]
MGECAAFSLFFSLCSRVVCFFCLGKRMDGLWFIEGERRNGEDGGVVAVRYKSKARRNDRQLKSTTLLLLLLLLSPPPWSIMLPPFALLLPLERLSLPCFPILPPFALLLSLPYPSSPANSV